MARRPFYPTTPPSNTRELPFPTSSPSHRPGFRMHRSSSYRRTSSPSPTAPATPYSSAYSSSSPTLGARLKRARLLRPSIIVLVFVLVAWRIFSGDAEHAHNTVRHYLRPTSPPDADAADPFHALTADSAPAPLVRVRPESPPPSKPLPIGQTRPRPGFPPPPADPPAAQGPQHTFLPNGLLRVNPLAPHPIYSLISSAQRAWAEKLARASQTLEQAVAEYHRRYGRAPPRGFDRWWAFVQRHGVRLPDEYDQIDKDLALFWAYTPRGLRRLQAATRRMPGTYTLSSSSALGRISLTATNLADSEEAVGLIRAREQLALLRGYDEVWMDEETDEETTVEAEIVRATGDWEATFSSHDVPAEFRDWEMDEERRTRISAGQTMDPFYSPPPAPYRGWPGACPPSSPLRHSYPPPPTLPIGDGQGKTFVWEHRESMSPCEHTELVHLVGFLSGHAERGPGRQEVHRLIFGMCKTSTLHSDVLTVASEQWTEDVGFDPPWEEKTDERLVWRGSTTGILNSPEVPWRASQRVRMVGMMGEREGNRSVLRPTPPDQPVGDPEVRRTNWLNTVLTDVAFTREPLQCREGVCEIMQDMFEWRGLVSQSWQNQYKYVMDIDGNGWSARFKRLMTTRSLMLKATIFPEWYQDRIQPWVHYVPIKMDLTDVYDVLTFFRGDVERGGEGGHDEEARRIAEAGREWSLEYFRKVDMVAYMWRLFLEYGRLVSDERDNMDFELP